MNLHKILQYLIDDSEFLTITEIVDTTIIEKTNNSIANIFSENKRLEPGELQDINEMPKSMTPYLTENHKRYGIYGTLIRSTRVVINNSFQTSLNLIFRRGLKFDDKSVADFEDFLVDAIKSNSQIDKFKNTVGVKDTNSKIAANMCNGNVTPEVIKRIVNILEINLLIFDLDSKQKLVYWSHGVKSKYINPFRRFYALVYTQGSYEPIIEGSDINYIKMYTKVLSDYESFTFVDDLTLHICSIMYVSKWPLTGHEYLRIMERFFPCKPFDIDERFDMLALACQ